MWKEEGITKSDVIEYYLSVAPKMVPLIRNRPLMLNRYPHGVPGQSFVSLEVTTRPKHLSAPEANKVSRYGPQESRGTV